MGSGHFLVEATDYIAREIVHAREIARQEELESEEVAEADIHWARREVVRNCIYGVDLNPMAVELAKLSLWLATVASNKPLSFLDHRLRCGNSLIGPDYFAGQLMPDADEMRRQWRTATSLALEKGAAVVVCHARPETLRAVVSFLPELSGLGIQAATLEDHPALRKR